jgi:hypothetical protein
MEGLLELLHGAVEGGSQEEDGQGPGVPGIQDTDANALFAGLILLNAATVVVADAGRARWHGFFHNEGDEFLNRVEKRQALGNSLLGTWSSVLEAGRNGGLIPSYAVTSTLGPSWNRVAGGTRKGKGAPLII